MRDHNMPGKQVINKIILILKSIYKQTAQMRQILSTHDIQIQTKKLWFFFFAIRQIKYYCLLNIKTLKYVSQRRKLKKERCN